MRGRGYHPRRSILAASFVVLGLVSIASAQVAGGGKTLQLRLGQTLEYSDNIDLFPGTQESILRSSTSFGLRYNDITRRHQLQLRFSGDYEADKNVNQISDPFARLSYALQGDNTRLELNADYRRTDLDDISIPLSLLLPEQVLENQIIDDVAQIEAGLRTDVTYALGFETGLRSTVGFKLDLSARDRRYDEDQIFDLADSQTWNASAQTTFRIDPQTTARFVASAARFKAEDAEQSERAEHSFGAGVIFDLTSTSALDLFIGHRRIVLDRSGISGEEDGAVFAVGLTRGVPNGNIVVDFNSRPTLNGRDAEVKISRSMTLRGGGGCLMGSGPTRPEAWTLSRCCHFPMCSHCGGDGSMWSWVRNPERAKAVMCPWC